MRSASQAVWSCNLQSGDSRASVVGQFYMGNWSIILDGYIEGVCCQDVSSQLGVNMPCTVIFASGSIPMRYARDSIILLYLLPWVCCSIRPPDTVPMTWCNGPHEPDHLSTRAIDYACILLSNQESWCREPMRMATYFLGLSVKVHGSYLKKATTEAPMELEFTKIEPTAARTLRVWKRHA